MKDILRRLLEAEEAGRQQAAGLESTGDEILRQAAVERDALVTQIQLETARQVDGLTREMAARIEDERAVISRRAAEAVQRLQTEATHRRRAAIDRVIAIALGEAAP